MPKREIYTLDDGFEGNLTQIFKHAQETGIVGLGLTYSKLCRRLREEKMNINDAIRKPVKGFKIYTLSDGFSGTPNECYDHYDGLEKAAVSYKSFRYRVNAGMDIEEAITRPMNNKNNNKGKNHKNREIWQRLIEKGIEPNVPYCTFCKRISDGETDYVKAATKISIRKKYTLYDKFTGNLTECYNHAKDTGILGNNVSLDCAKHRLLNGKSIMEALTAEYNRNYTLDDGFIGGAKKVYDHLKEIEGDCYIGYERFRYLLNKGMKPEEAFKYRSGNCVDYRLNDGFKGSLSECYTHAKDIGILGKDLTYFAFTKRMNNNMHIQDALTRDIDYESKKEHGEINLECGWNGSLSELINMLYSINISPSVSRSTINTRINKGWHPLEAIIIPAKI